jgi:hypothetical protein
VSRARRESPVAAPSASRLGLGGSRGQPIGGWPSSRSTRRGGRASDGVWPLPASGEAVGHPWPRAARGGAISRWPNALSWDAAWWDAPTSRRLDGRPPMRVGTSLAGVGTRRPAAARAGPCGAEAPCARRCTQARVPTADLQLEASGQDWGRPPGASLSRSPKRAATPRSAPSLLWHTPMLSRPRWDLPARRHGRQGAGRVRKRTGSDVPGARDDPARAHVVPSHHGGRRAGGRARLRGRRRSGSSGSKSTARSPRRA